MRSDCLVHPAPHGGERALRADRLVLDCAPVITGEGFYVGPFPDLAHIEHNLGCGKVLVLDDLLHALATNAAEHAPDLGGPHKMMHSENHSHHATCHLTTGQECGTLVT
jgi:hypothetical protein